MMKCVIVYALPLGYGSNNDEVYHVTPPLEVLSKHLAPEFEPFAVILIIEM